MIVKIYGRTERTEPLVLQHTIRHNDPHKAYGQAIHFGQIHCGRGNFHCDCGDSAVPELFTPFLEQNRRSKKYNKKQQTLLCKL